MFFKFQQIAGPEGGAGTETFAPASDRRERKDGQVAVHPPMRRADGRDQATTHGSNSSGFFLLFGFFFLGRISGRFHLQIAAVSK